MPLHNLYFNPSGNPDACLWVDSPSKWSSEPLEQATINQIHINHTNVSWLEELFQSVA
jgi:hypothetical protein